MNQVPWDRQLYIPSKQRLLDLLIFRVYRAPRKAPIDSSHNYNVHACIGRHVFYSLWKLEGKKVYLATVRTQILDFSIKSPTLLSHHTVTPRKCVYMYHSACTGMVELVDCSDRLEGLKRISGLSTWKVRIIFIVDTIALSRCLVIFAPRLMPMAIKSELI